MLPPAPFDQAFLGISFLLSCSWLSCCIFSFRRGGCIRHWLTWDVLLPFHVYEEEGFSLSQQGGIEWWKEGKESVSSAARHWSGCGRQGDGREPPSM